MRRILTAAAVAFVSVAASVALLTPQDISPQPEAVVAERPAESKAVVLPDGGPGYVWPALLLDGGSTLVFSDVAPCVRRPADVPVSDCLRRTDDGGTRDPGELSRFPASESVGAN